VPLQVRVDILSQIKLNLQLLETVNLLSTVSKKPAMQGKANSASMITNQSTRQTITEGKV
jgi:hypothetical protein